MYTVSKSFPIEVTALNDVWNTNKRNLRAHRSYYNDTSVSQKSLVVSYNRHLRFSVLVPNDYESPRLPVSGAWCKARRLQNLPKLFVRHWFRLILSYVPSGRDSFKNIRCSHPSYECDSLLRAYSSLKPFGLNKTSSRSLLFKKLTRKLYIDAFLLMLRDLFDERGTRYA